MSATEASKQALCRHARQRSDNVRKRIDKALTDLRRSGATAAIENSWILPNSMPNIIDLKCQVVGSKGMLNLDTSHNRTVEKYTQSEAEYPDFLVMPTIYGEQKGFAADSIRHFVDCVLADTPPRVTGEDGLIVTRIIQAIEESVRTKMPVEV